MAQNPVGWFEIYVQDMERARRFYEAVFKVALGSLSSGSPERWAFPGDMTTYGAPGALVRMDGFPSGGNSTLVYFSCPDCAVEAGRIPGAGGKVVKEKFAIGEYGFIALALDTEGNMFGLHSLN
jgi:predicted enzyme related to lactoylglutathione lyase